jgi:chromosome partitioning protein
LIPLDGLLAHQQQVGSIALLISSSNTITLNHSTMRIIAIFSPLGGVGKTTLAVNLAASLSELGKRVLLVDLDAQSSATMALGLATEPGGSLHSALVNGTSPRAVIRSTRLPSLFVIRSHIELLEVDMRVTQRDHHQTRLREVIAELRALPDFDCILLDCPSSMGVMTSAAMAAADELLVPLKPGFFMWPLVSCLLAQIQHVIESGVNPGLHMGGFVINRFEGNAAQLSEVARALQATAEPYVSGNVVYLTTIPDSVVLTEAPCSGQTILEYDPNGVAARAFQDLAQEFLDRGTNKPAISIEIEK